MKPSHTRRIGAVLHAARRRFPPSRRTAFAAAKVAFAVTLVVVLLSAVDTRAAARALVSADPRWLAAAFLALTLQTVFSALRWRITARQLEQHIGLRRCVSEYYLSQVLNQSLPGGMVGDAGRAFRARGQAGLRLASLAVALERVAGQLALVVVMLLGLVAALLMPGGLRPPLWLVALVLAIGAGVFAAGAMLLLAKWLPGAPGRGATALVNRVSAALLAPRVLIWQALTSLATAVCIVAAFAFCARATGTVLPGGAIAVLIPLILFAMLAPVTVSGWGLREGAAVALFPLAGASGADGLAASVAFGLVFLAAVLPGIGPLLAGRRARRGEVAANEAPALRSSRGAIPSLRN